MKLCIGYWLEVQTKKTGVFIVKNGFTNSWNYESTEQL
jgi:hypothetical protein